MREPSQEACRYPWVTWRDAAAPLPLLQTTWQRAAMIPLRVSSTALEFQVRRECSIFSGSNTAIPLFVWCFSSFSSSKFFYFPFLVLLFLFPFTCLLSPATSYLSVCCLFYLSTAMDTYCSVYLCTDTFFIRKNINPFVFSRDFFSTSGAHRELGWWPRRLLCWFPFREIGRLRTRPPAIADVSGPPRLYFIVTFV